MFFFGYPIGAKESNTRKLGTHKKAVWYEPTGSNLSWKVGFRSGSDLCLSPEVADAASPNSALLGHAPRLGAPSNKVYSRIRC